MKELNDVIILVNVSMAAMVQSLKKRFPLESPKTKHKDFLSGPHVAFKHQRLCSHTPAL